MKTLIVCVSVSHGNTRKIASAMADVLGAEVVEPETVNLATLGDYDLVGFGSGIFGMAFHPRLRTFVASLPTANRGKALCSRRAAVRSCRSGSTPTPWSRCSRPRASRSSGRSGAGASTPGCRSGSSVG